MRVAISTDGEYVSAHFGRCPSFTLADIEEGKLVSKKVIENPGHHPGYIPQYLSEKGVNCMVAGGMGMRAKELFKDANIDIILGVEGNLVSLYADNNDGGFYLHVKTITESTGKW